MVIIKLITYKIKDKYTNNKKEFKEPFNINIEKHMKNISIYISI